MLSQTNNLLSYEETFVTMSAFHLNKQTGILSIRFCEATYPVRDENGPPCKYSPEKRNVYLGL